MASWPASLVLAGDFGARIEALPAVGPLLALTRNEALVIEKPGRFEQVEVYRQHGMGQVVGSDVDLRLFLRHWINGVAAIEQGRGGPRRSLQFFDGHGVAVHKLYEVGDTDAVAFTALVEPFRGAAPGAAQPPVKVLPEPAPEPPRPDADIDLAGFRSAWRALTNTHDFHGLLSRFGVEHRQAMLSPAATWRSPLPEPSTATCWASPKAAGCR